MRPFLDSPTPKQYGPRGFWDGRNYSGFARNARCRSAWPTSMAEDTARAETGTGRPKRPLSPRGSSVSANGSPTRRGRTGKSKLVSSSKSRSVGARPRLPALDRAGRRCPGRRGHRLAARPLARYLAVGDDRVSAARLCRRRAQRDAGGGCRPTRLTGIKAEIGVAKNANGRRSDPSIRDHQARSRSATIGGHEIAFTNSALFMVIAVGRHRGAADRRDARRARWCRAGMQSIAELSYEFVANTIKAPPARRG